MLVPQEYDEFNQLILSYPVKDQRIVLERMVKSNHPALNGTNKAKMEKLFAFLMQYVHDLSSEEGRLHLLNDVVPVAFDVAQLVPPTSISSTLLDVLLEKREELSNLKKKPVSIASVLFIYLHILFVYLDLLIG